MEKAKGPYAIIEEVHNAKSELRQRIEEEMRIGGIQDNSAKYVSPEKMADAMLNFQKHMDSITNNRLESQEKEMRRKAEEKARRYATMAEDERRLGKMGINGRDYEERAIRFEGKSEAFREMANDMGYR